jgi:GNAT superfamily N-acetyltransferase
MAFNIRPAVLDEDSETVAHLLSETGPEPTTGDELREEDARFIPGKLRRRYVAVDADNEILGYSSAVYYPSQPTGLFNIEVVVAEGQRRNGVGAALYGQVIQFAMDNGAEQFICQIKEESSDGLVFAQRRGFTIQRHVLGLTLDLATFDETRFEGLEARVATARLRLFPWSETGNTPEARRQLYQINRIASVDDPSNVDGGFPEFDAWEKIVLAASWFQPEGQMIAADEERYVGLSAVVCDDETNVAESALTGVHQAYRGRGIAQALKMMTIRFARDQGATQLKTFTEASNKAMLAINRKLGFRPEPGFYVLVKA